MNYEKIWNEMFSIYRGRNRVVEICWTKNASKLTVLLLLEGAKWSKVQKLVGFQRQA